MMMDRCPAKMETGEAQDNHRSVAGRRVRARGPAGACRDGERLPRRTRRGSSCVRSSCFLGLTSSGWWQTAKRRTNGAPPIDAADVTYCTSKELVFDFLRDRLALGRHRGMARQMVQGLTTERGGRPLLLRGLHVAIVDEADSILIDEARTPLILAGAEKVWPDTAGCPVRRGTGTGAVVGTRHALVPGSRGSGNAETNAGGAAGAGHWRTSPVGPGLWIAWRGARRLRGTRIGGVASLPSRHAIASSPKARCQDRR